ncbi:MAG: hypothetical protein ACRC8M_04745 [Cetobacterium sp.]|uniref:hypothetical protein n=1 Tax=Cetobacterium sp. TaxID=2071632 RepID=UPI003F2C6216
MYIDKNKGFSIVEILSTLAVITIIFQILFYYLKYINIERKLEMNRFRFNKNMKLILEGINTSIYESLEYKIYNLDKVNFYIDYSKLSLKNGNTLIVEKYVPGEESYSDIEIYYSEGSTITSFSGKRKRKNEIYVELGSRESVIKNLKVNFSLEDYGVSMEGYYLNEKFKKEFKK